MKNVASFFIGVYASVVLCSGCPPTPTPTPPGPSPSPTPATCASVCSHLRDLGCPEGLSDNCQATCESTSPKINYNLSCLATASTVTLAQACGSVDCDVQAEEATVGTCASACAQVKKLGCPEAADCLATCQKDASKINFKLLCLTRSKTRADLQACGSVSCK